MTFSNALEHVLGLFGFCFKSNIVWWLGTHAKTAIGSDPKSDIY